MDRLALWWCSGPVLVSDVAASCPPEGKDTLWLFPDLMFFLFWLNLIGSQPHEKTWHTPQPPYSIKRPKTTAAKASYTSNMKCQHPCAKPGAKNIASIVFAWKSSHPSLLSGGLMRFRLWGALAVNQWAMGSNQMLPSTREKCYCRMFYTS